MSEQEKEYMTLAQAADAVGLKRASLYYYIKKLNIETQQYELNKHTYILKEDVERIKAVKDKPWQVSKAKPKVKDAA